ncbi:MAG: pilus assembly protein TadG-related protein [Actinomycetota bacterium]
MSGREGGQTTVLMLGLSLVCFAVAGVAVDGTRAFLLRRTLQNAADSAALAGAGELDRTRYYSSAGRDVVLDPDGARRMASEWLHRRGIRAAAAIAAERDAVNVALRDRLPTTFLNLIGVRSLPVAVEARAEPRFATPI